MNNGVTQTYKEGDTVEFTVDTSSFEEGIVISDITVETETDKINVSPVEGKENTFSFIMPGRICRLVVKTETEGVEKDENGYYLVGTLDDLKKVKQTIDLGNNDINIKLTFDNEKTVTIDFMFCSIYAFVVEIIKFIRLNIIIYIAESLNISGKMSKLNLYKPYIPIN